MPKRLVASLLALSLLTFSAIAQNKPAPESKKPDAKPTTQPTVLPEVSLQEVSVFDAIQFLRDVDPSFQAVVAYGPGADPNKPPIIHELKLKNITADDVIAVLGEVLPFVSIDRITLNDGKLLMIRINADPNSPEPEEARESKDPTTTIYPLRAIIDNMSRNAMPRYHPADEEKQFAAALTEQRKQSRDAVLALVQTAIQTEGVKGNVTLKVHEPTETLIFKGSKRETVLVQGALDALAPQASEPPSDSEVKALREEVRKLRAQIASGRDGNHPATRPSEQTPAKNP
jgi:hypothetical protein